MLMGLISIVLSHKRLLCVAEQRGFGLSLDAADRRAREVARRGGTERWHREVAHSGLVGAVPGWVQLGLMEDPGPGSHLVSPVQQRVTASQGQP